MRLRHFLFCLSIGIALIGCQQEQKNQAVISGTLLNPGLKTLTLGDSLVNVNENGNFRFTLAVNEPDFFTFKGGKEIDLFVSPGDSLHLTFDPENFYATFKTEGNGAKANRYLLHQTKIFNNAGSYINQNWSTLFRLSPADFEVKLDSLHEVLEAPLQDFKATASNPDSWLIKRQQAEIDYSIRYYKTLYPSQHRNFTGERIPQTDTFLAGIRANHMSRAGLLKSPTYRLFLRLNIDIQAENIRENNPENLSKNAAQFIAIKELIDDQKILNHFLTENIKQHIDNYGIKYVNPQLKEYKQLCTDEKARNEVLALYEEVMQEREGAEIVTYKESEDYSLDAYIYKPKELKEGDKRAVYVFFHGGGWSVGMPEWGRQNCKKYAKLGMVAISIEYRLKDIHNTEVSDAIEDAKSAIRWVRANADQLNIDPDRVVAAGFSAGGHLAISTAVLEGFDSPSENLQINAKPNAVIGQSSPFDTAQDRFLVRTYGKGKARSFSPLDHLKPGLPPMLIHYGRYDHLVPKQAAKEFQVKMKEAGNSLEFYTYQTGHFFGNEQDELKVDERTVIFLTQHGFLSIDKEAL